MGNPTHLYNQYHFMRNFSKMWYSFLKSNQIIVVEINFFTYIFTNISYVEVEVEGGGNISKNAFHMLRVRVWGGGEILVKMYDTYIFTNIFPHPTLTLNMIHFH
jgi:hypothetical protein